MRPAFLDYLVLSKPCQTASLCGQGVPSSLDHGVGEFLSEGYSQDNSAQLKTLLCSHQ